MKTRDLSKQGFVLPLFVIMLVIFLLLGYGMLSLGFQARVKSLRNTEDIYAVSAAEAGITHGLIRMNDKLDSEKIWDNTTLSGLNLSDVNLPKASAYYDIQITGDPASSFLLKSTGRSGQAERVFCAFTMLRSVYEFSILVKKDLILYPKSSVVGYDSTTGKTGLKTLIGTKSIGEGSVIVMNGALVDGDVMVGVAGDPNLVIKNSGTINGTSYAMLVGATFPEVYPEAGLPGRGFINGETTITEPTATGKYTHVSLGNDDVLEVVGNVVMHVEGNINLKNGAEIKIRDDGNSSLILYLDGNLDCKEGSGINNATGVPANFQLFGTGPEGQTIELKAKNEFYGAVYAPNASLSIKAKGDIYGSFVGTNFEMKSKSKFHHDHALGKVGINDEGTFFAVNRWFEL